MTLIDPTRTWSAVEARLATETDSKRRRNLEIVLEHMKAEAAGDLDGLMATVSEHAAYHAYGTTERAMNPVGKDEVRTFYENFIASGATRLQFEVDRLVVDDDCVLTEGLMRMAYPGRTLAARGTAVGDPDAYYLYETRMAVLWPFDADGLIIGEDTYTGVDGFAGIAARPLRPEDIAA
jgi:ketosteroid isomerase-like protein